MILLDSGIYRYYTNYLESSVAPSNAFGQLSNHSGVVGFF